MQEMCNTVETFEAYVSTVATRQEILERRSRNLTLRTLAKQAVIGHKRTLAQFLTAFSQLRDTRTHRTALFRDRRLRLC
jgi:hypothetical protein